MGQNGREDDVDIRRKRTPSLPCNKSIVKSSAQKQRRWKIVDQDTITTVFRTIPSVNQLSLYGAVAEMCEECESFHDRTVKPAVGGQSSSSLVLSVIKKDVPCG